MEETVIWYGIYKGNLCRMRINQGGKISCEVWKKWSWEKGPDFTKLSFKGMPLEEEEALSWIRKRFRERKVQYCQEF